MLDAGKLQHELKVQGLSLTELAARSGLNYSHLSNMKNGKIRDVKLETILVLARHLNNIPPYKLMSDTVLEVARQDVRDAIGSLPKERWMEHLETVLQQGPNRTGVANRYPIIGHVKENGEHTLPRGRTGIASGEIDVITVPFDNVADPEAYAVVVEDSMMATDVKPGSVLLFGPHNKVADMSLCLVRTKQDDHVWVRYITMDGSRYILLSKNDIARPVVLKKPEIAEIHPCLAHYYEEKPQGR